jgi:uncharacterized protein involved in outer membrane biogenesis
MTRTGWILTWIVAAIGALLIALVLFIALFNWNRARPWLGQKLSSSIGRPMAINGDLTVDWLRNPDAHGLANWIPWPRFVARDISIANPEWARQRRFATVQEVRFSLSPLALIGHTIDIPSLKLIGPSVDIERDKEGRANWHFNFAKGPGGKWKLDIGEVALGAGKVRMDDDKLDLHMDFTLQPLGKPIPFSEIMPPASGARSSAPPPHSDQKYYFAWTAKGTWRGANASGSGKLGSVLAMSDASMPFPLQADLRLRDLHIAVVGTLTDPAHLGALDMNLEMSGESMSHLYALTGVALPPTKLFTTRGRLFAKVHEGIFKYQHFDGKVGNSDIHGSATYATAGARPKLTATLTSNVLDFGDLSPLIGADSNAAKARRGEPQKQPADKLLPVEKFDTTRWRKMDADVHFTGKRIVRKSNLPISDLSAHLVMDDGVLTLDPLALSAAGGDLTAHIRMEGRKDPMHGEATLSLRHLKLGKLFPTVNLMHTSLGEINGDAKLDGDGNSVATLLGTSDGEVKILIDDGEVSKLLVEEIGLNVGNIIITKLVGDKPEKLNCAAADIVAKQGLWRPQIFVIDTETMTINVEGSIDLADETLDLTIHPHSKGVRILSLRSPLYLRGTLKHPDAGVEKGPLLARGVGAAVLGAVAAPVAALAALIAPSHDEDNACRGVIEAMRKPAKKR